MSLLLFSDCVGLVVYLDDLAHADPKRNKCVSLVSLSTLLWLHGHCDLPKRERLLAWILRAPKLLREVSVLSIPRAVHCDMLPLLWEDAVTSSEDCLRESHGG
jgi:1,2-phenylacetyl-CoA epoxidase catalytic subunit